MPDSETIATAITDEHQHVPVKVTSWPIVSWVGQCLYNSELQTGSKPKLMYVHPATAKLILGSLFHVQAEGYGALVVDNVRVESTFAVPRYCASILLEDNRVAIADHNADILVVQ